ncbi:MAG: FAD-dependent oxidoreductase [Candidatus Omnitrophota bacterium]
MNKDLDLIIIGAGIAGVNAAVYAKRSGLNFKIFESKVIGGQLFYMERIDNYLGIELGARGSDLAKRLTQTLSGLDITVQSEEVKKIEKQNNQLQTLTDKGQYTSKAAIIATGSSFKKLGIEDEDKFAGQGISYCAVCDGFFFKNKDVAVVGGGNTAVEEALYLSNIAKSVTLIHRRDKLRALHYLQKNLEDKENITIIYNHNIKKLEGPQRLERLVLEEVNTKEKTNLALDGLFVAIGASPNTDFCQAAVATDERGFILTNNELKTSSNSIWACGDCRKRPLRQLITAASEGAIASIEIYKCLRQSYLSV